MTKLVPVYWVSGDELVLVDQAIESIRSQAHNHGFSERLVFFDEPEIDWEQVQFQLNNLSLFASKKLIEIRLKTAKLAAIGLDIIQRHASHSTNDLQTIILIISPKLDQKTQKTKWFTSIAKSISHTQTRLLLKHDFLRWIMQEFQRENYEISLKFCQQIADFFAGDLSNAKQAIEMLKLQVSDKKILDSHFDLLKHYDKRGNVFELIDLTLIGDYKKCHELLKSLQQEAMEPLLIVSLLAREIRLLYQLMSLCGTHSFQQAARQLGIWQNRQIFIKQAIQRLTQEKLLALLQKLNQIDQAVKGMLKLNVWIELERVVLELMGKNVNLNRLRPL